MKKNTFQRGFRMCSRKMASRCLGLSSICFLTTPLLAANPALPGAVENVMGTEMSQQVITASGQIKDASGAPLIGVSIVLSTDKTVGTITDFDGNFTINNVPKGAKLIISYIGFKELTLPAKQGMNITMEEDTKALDEVVVVGFGTQKKVNVIGSIAMVDSKKLENRATSSVVSALTGQMPGVTVTQAGGRPGIDTGTIRVRGVGSFGADADALVLIDGIPGNMTDLNPSDIESISVLKDAATAAIYGARAANGVILVTTKTGKEEKVSISYNGYVGFNNPTTLPKHVDSWDYARLLNEAEGMEAYSPEEIQKMKDGSDPDNYGNIDKMDMLFGENGIQTGHDLSVRGGGKKTQYFASFGYLHQDGLVRNNDYERFTGRLNLTSEIAKNLKMTIRMRGDRSKVHEPNIAGTSNSEGLEGIVGATMRVPRLYPALLQNGNFAPGFKGNGHPMAGLYSDAFIDRVTHRLNTSIGFDYTPIKGLKISAMGAYNYQQKRKKSFRANLPVEVGGRIMMVGPATLSESSGTTEYKSFQGTVNYTTSLNEKHNIDALIGYSWEDQSFRDLEASREGYANNNFPYLSVGSPDVQKNKGGGHDWVIQSFFGRFQYNFKERYLAEATMRYDGSSRFPADSRYAFFPSGALGWRISEESFIKDNEKLKFITNLKLKASVGILGNNNIGDYPYQSVYNLGTAYNYSTGGLVNQGAAMTTYTDPKLKWETTRTFDLGFESVLWNGLLSANVTYFDRYTYDILYKPNSSASCGFGLNMSQVNTGEMSNRGWEFELGHRHHIGDFNYSINGNFSIIHNKIQTLGVGDVKQANGLVGDGSKLFIGYPMDIYYGYKTDGVFLDQADIDEYFAHTDQTAMGSDKAHTKPGDIRYVDISGPEGKPDGKVDATYDKVYLGSRIPKYTFGVTFNANYKGFDFNLFLQGIAGVQSILDDYNGWALWSDGDIQKWQMEKAFDPENPTRYPGYPRITNLGNSIGVNNQRSDFWVRNASYVRVKNVQLGYTLPKSWLSGAKISSLRFYVSAENPLTFSHYPEGLDPELKPSNAFYPILSTYTFGVNLKF